MRSLRILLLLVILASLETSQLGATETGFYPTPPPGVTYHTATGVLINYGIGMKSGIVRIQPSSGKPIEFFVSTSMTIDGKSITCVAPPQGAWTPSPDLCNDWPTTLVLGKTKVTVTYWTTTRNGVNVNATNKLTY